VVREQLQLAGTELRRLEESIEALTQDRNYVAQLKPGFFSRLFNTRSYRDWRDRMTQVVQQVTNARDKLAKRQEEFNKLRSEQAIIDGELHSLRTDYEHVLRKLATMEKAISTQPCDPCGRLPDAAFWQQNEQDLQLTSPWMVPAFLEARDKLFVSSLELHRAFIDGSALYLRQNLGAAIALLGRRTLSQTQEPARRSIWASLFMVVPVMSTTFASTARLFGPRGREQLGWLLIDEAGQASPQAAVGALWRARRVIAIGDPMQIQPVVVMPPRLTNAIFGAFTISPDEWSAPSASVQRLADRASWFGTTIRHQGGDTWVGCPLRVHRRCEEPMFSISNNIAYNGLMVQSTPVANSPIGTVLGSSAWFDIKPGARVSGKWSGDEGQVATDLLLKLLAGGLADPDIFFITPFRIVAQNLRSLVTQDRALRNRLPGDPSTWAQNRIGTVHTFQGKEAEAVVLVLGAPLPQSTGARRWAGYPPNLLNVAVSRAKHRLYVIGSVDAWRNAGVFSELARDLPLGRLP